MLIKGLIHCFHTVLANESVLSLDGMTIELISDSLMNSVEIEIPKHFQVIVIGNNNFLFKDTDKSKMKDVLPLYLDACGF